ncbi:MAG: aminotransferase class I/II-fold pyridoxal phosphate-dependent enzyme, partial [bacterium]|nr:aminotransferase class I/II-fold pyridoxal phosphate-dependent enzyme [bacterium]
NYPQTFAMRTGAVMRTAPGYRDGRYNTHAIAEALEDLPPGEPAIALLNFPSNPGGYSPSVEERAQLRRTLLAVADQRPLLVILDEAYGGYVHEQEIPSTSMFWELVGAHEQLIPLKVDGATKEFSFFGGRVGFITFPIEPDSPAAKALESKVMSLMRSTVGSPVATSQVILLQALRSGRAAEEVEQARRLARERYLVLKPLLAELDPELLRPLPFNSGFFALIEVPEGLGFTAEQLRHHLIEHHDTGIVSVPPRYLRVAICSLASEAIPEMMARVVRGAEELAAGKAA